MILSFKKQFLDPIITGSKIHTIRADKPNRWKPGNKIHFATGEKLWSENPEECKAQGYPVKDMDVKSRQLLEQRDELLEALKKSKLQIEKLSVWADVPAEDRKQHYQFINEAITKTEDSNSKNT